MEVIVKYDCEKINESESILETEELNSQFTDLLLDVDSQINYQSAEKEKQVVSRLARDKDENIELDFIIKDKMKKKKKKPKVSGQSPNRIMMFNVAEQQKLQEMKLNQKSTQERKLLKSFTFPAPASDLSELSALETFDGGKLQAHNSGESLASEFCMSGSPDIKSSLLMRLNSFPVKSALRGSCKELGSGPRPKLSVKWAPDVYEPVQTSVSHTVNHNHLWHQRKEGHKKGKNNRIEMCKKHEKKHLHKSRCSNNSSKLRMQAAYTNLGHKRDEFLERQPIYMSLPTDEAIDGALLPLTLSRKDYSSPVVVGEAEPEKTFGMKSDQQLICPKAPSTSESPLHSKCFGPFPSLGCKLIYGELV